MLKVSHREGRVAITISEDDFRDAHINHETDNATIFLLDLEEAVALAQQILDVAGKIDGT